MVFLGPGYLAIESNDIGNGTQLKFEGQGGVFGACSLLGEEVVLLTEQEGPCMLLRSSLTPDVTLIPQASCDCRRC